MPVLLPAQKNRKETQESYASKATQLSSPKMGAMGPEKQGPITLAHPSSNHDPMVPLAAQSHPRALIPSVTGPRPQPSQPSLLPLPTTF